MPAAHAEHLAALSFDDVPPSHLEQALLPASEYEPLPHDEHSAAPVLECVPPGHDEQLREPAAEK